MANRPVDPVHHNCYVVRTIVDMTMRDQAMGAASGKHFLVVSDFDQTLSFNDSGQILSELLGVSDFRQKVDGLAASNLVQQGGELAYLIRHDPAFRSVRREHL